MKRNYLLSLLLCLLMTVPFTLQAQTAPDADDNVVGAGPARDEPAAVADTDTSTDAATDADTDAEEEIDGNARFIPTEQVSQDLGVSFPVDI